MSKFFKISLVKSLRCRKTVVSAEIHHLLLRRRTTVNCGNPADVLHFEL